MRYLLYAIPMALVAALVIVSPASAQRGPRGGEELRETMRKHLAECEVCAALNKQIEELQAQLDDLDRQKEALRLERLEAKINELAAAHPALKDQLEALLAECKKAADLEKQARETADATRNLLDGLQLEPEDRAALNEAVGPLDQGPPRDRQFNRFVNQRQRLRRDRDPQAADRLAQMEAEHKRQLEALKQSDPKLYEITVKEEELTTKLDDLQNDLRETMRQHLRNAQQ
jgi:DNA repair exonuclease SbcCD ATPase subunit